MYHTIIRIGLCWLAFSSCLTAQTASKSAFTTRDYGEMFGSVNTLNTITIGMPLDSFLNRLITKKVKSSFDFRQEYYRKVDERGLRGLSYIFDTDGDKPLYEIIYEFENADTLSALMESDMGPANHPTLADHWILGKSPDGTVSMLWYFNNKIVIAANLAHTELENDASFQLPDNLFEPPADAANTPIEESGTSDINLQMNTYLTSASIDDLQDLKGVAVEGKKDEFMATLPYDGAEQTLVRKNAAGKWRLEARRGFDNMDAAKNYYDEQLQVITSLEGLQYRLVRKAEYSTNTGSTYVWEVQTQDDQPLGVMVKLQLYAAGNNRFGVKMETGKE